MTSVLGMVTKASNVLTATHPRTESDPVASVPRPKSRPAAGVASVKLGDKHR